MCFHAAKTGDLLQVICCSSSISRSELMFSRLEAMNQFSLFRLTLQVVNSSDNNRDDLGPISTIIIIIIIIIVVVVVAVVVVVVINSYLGSTACTIKRKFELTSWSDLK